MGIPGLTLRLINRGHWITMEQVEQLQGLELEQNPSDHSGQQSLGPPREKEQQQQQQQQQQQSCKIAIIDGPSLAYHICGEYREGRLANNEVTLSPSYGEIGCRTIQFLEDLEAVTLKIHAIYFDGVLPPSKLDTRKQRLQKNMAQLKEAGSRARHIKAQKVPLPEPPFLVPAVLEALKDSKFSNLVTVVPAEADSYCAEEAAAYEARTGKMATIVTNDSDLLIQASGAQTRVMLLKGLTRSRAPAPIKVEANVFFPAQLAATAGVDSLIPTAFFMNEDYHLSFDAAVAKAKRTDVSNNPYFTAFRKGLEKPQYSISNLASPVIKSLQQMDPRIAELAHQLMPGFPKSLNEPANVFLPPLIEDVGKFSAWVAARDIREAAYRMLMSSTHNAHYVAEWTRRGTTAHYDSCPLIPGWRGKLLELKGILEGVRAYPGLELATAAQRFNYIAMYYTVKAFADRNQVLSQGNILRILTKGTQRSREELHALAMCQASIYSLRILKQLLVLEKAMNGLDEEFAALEDLLGEAPSLAALFEKCAIDSEDFWRDLAGGLRDTVV